MTSRSQHWPVLGINRSSSKAKKRLARRWLTALVYQCGLDYPGGSMASSTRRTDADASRQRVGFGGLGHEPSEVPRTIKSDETGGLVELKREVAGIVRRDYGQALRQCLSRWEVREIAKEGKTRVWPRLNREQNTLVSPKEFVRQWSAFGVDFKFASLPWKEGLSLLGFYVGKIDRVRMRPLIFVNTAHHPAVVGVALDHEMGHHLTSKIFASDERAHLLSQTGLEEHLAEPAELAADTLVSLGIFPAPIARTLLDGAGRPSASNQSVEPSDPAMAKLLEYTQTDPITFQNIANHYHFRFDQIRGVKERFQALAAFVHYTKLRRALLDEYNT